MDVVGEHKEGVDIAVVRGGARDAYAGERYRSEADWTESVAKEGQGIGCRRVGRDGVCFYGTDSEAQDIWATEPQGCDSVPLGRNVSDEHTIYANNAIRTPWSSSSV